MARDEPASHHTAPAGLHSPAVALIGSVDSLMAEKLRDALASAEDDGDFVIEMTTQGGDAELGRRLAYDIRQAASRRRGRVLFLGKTEVYSAGVTAMAGVPRENRFLTSDAMLFIHCRQLSKTLNLEGPLRGNLPKLDQVRREIESGLALEERGFRELIAGSDVSYEEIDERALAGWYIDADEALRRGLIAGVV
jgi:ATP-dependent protease ClpP protease subunit